jgi:hypothetical protein
MSRLTKPDQALIRVEHWDMKRLHYVSVRVVPMSQVDEWKNRVLVRVEVLAECMTYEEAMALGKVMGRTHE